MWVEAGMIMGRISEMKGISDAIVGCGLLDLKVQCLGWDRRLFLAVEAEESGEFCEPVQKRVGCDVVTGSTDDNAPKAVPATRMRCGGEQLV